MATRGTRRNFLGMVALGGAGVALLGPSPVGSAAAMHGQVGGSVVGQATMPAWTFVVHEVQRPYAGEILRPEEWDPGVTFVGIDVEIVNDSDAPLDFSVSSIRLLDADGMEHSYSGVVGTEPRIVNINMLPGVRTRGWTWFAVPETVEVVGCVYIPPAARLRVPVVANAPGATPAS